MILMSSKYLCWRSRVILADYYYWVRISWLRKLPKIYYYMGKGLLSYLDLDYFLDLFYLNLFILYNLLSLSFYIFSFSNFTSSLFTSISFIFVPLFAYSLLLASGLDLIYLNSGKFLLDWLGLTWLGISGFREAFIYSLGLFFIFLMALIYTFIEALTLFLW